MQIVANNVNCFFGAYIGKLKDIFCKPDMQIVANNVRYFFGAYIGKLNDVFYKNLICK